MLASQLDQEFSFLRLDLDLDEIEYCNQIPGVWADAAKVRAPANVAWLIEDFLHEVGQEVDVVAQQTLPRAKLDSNAVPFWHAMRPWQRKLARWLVANRGGHCWAEAGAGKTWVAVATIIGLGAPTLYVVPAFAVKQHCGEVRMLTEGQIGPFELRAESRKRKGDNLEDYWLSQRQPVVVCGWEQMRDRSDVLIRLLGRRPSLVIWDEAPRAKNPNRETWVTDQEGNTRSDGFKSTVSAQAFRVACAATYRVATTASPGDNRLIDLWGQLTLVEPWAWGRTTRKFAYRYCGAVTTQWGWSTRGRDGCAGPSNEDELEERLSFIARRTPYSVSHAGLPPVVETACWLDASELREPLPGIKGQINILMRRQAKGRLSPHDEGQLAELLLIKAAESKTHVVLERIRTFSTRGKGKVIVFTARRAHCDLLATKVDKLGIQSWSAHGGASAKARHEIQQAYMDHPGPCVLVTTYQSMGMSLNLQDTDYMCMCMMPHKHTMYQQAVGRGDRQRLNPRSLHVEVLIGEGTIDEAYVRLLREKAAHTERVHAGLRIDGFGTLLSRIATPEQAAEVQASVLEFLRAKAAG